jgi:hypothetical protein
MKVTEREEGLVAIDQARRSVTVDLGREPSAEDGGYLFADRDTVAYEAQTITRVETDRLETSHVGVTVVHPESGEHERLEDDHALEIGPERLVVVRTPVLLLVRPECSGTVYRDTKTVIDLDEETTVTLGFRTKADFPEETMRVHESAEGVARAISALQTAIPVTSPDRTWPNVRNHPPRIELCSDRSRENTDKFDPEPTDVELVVPETDALEYLFPTAPLAYYLGATVSVESGVNPHLRAGSVTESLGEDSDTADRTASALLRRCFYLDCLARSAGPYGEELAEHHLLTNAGLDAAELYDADIAERVQQYLALSEDETERLDVGLPTWHLGVHVRPTMNHVPSLSQHLSKLSDIYPPEAATLKTVKEQFEWSEERKIRGPPPRAEIDEAWVSPDDRAATVGWQAPRRALGAFNVTEMPEVRPREERELSIAVVQATRDWPGENVIEQYGERDLPLSVESYYGVKAETLAGVFESDYDLVHVIGHHEVGRGIECRDEYLSPTQISECGAETFFLNACGSIEFGEQLVKRGAVAGAVTTRSVTNESAATVGMNWGRLISLGWSIERALSFARSVDDPSGYVAVGDGTHTVGQTDSTVPAKFTAQRASSDEWSVGLSHNGPREIGQKFSDKLTVAPYLRGSHRTHKLRHAQFAKLFNRLDSPVLYDGEIKWVLPD